MKRLIDYIFEGLSADNIVKLEEYITNDNINDVIKILRTKKIIKSIDDDSDVSELKTKLVSFLTKHGLSKKFINWGRGGAVKTLYEIFDDNNQTEQLENIINNDGIVSWNTFYEAGKNGKIANIYNDVCSDFKKSAEEVANITNVTAVGATTAVGKFEILMKLIINEGTSGSKGDVTLSLKSETGVEVKASKLFGVGGARVTGMIKGLNAASIIYDTLNKYLLPSIFNGGAKHITASTHYTTNEYFKSESTVKSLEKLLNDIWDNGNGTIIDISSRKDEADKQIKENQNSDITIYDVIGEDFYYALVYAVASQYNNAKLTIKDESGKKKTVNFNIDNNTYNKLANSICSANKSLNWIIFDEKTGYKIDVKGIINIVGALQLFCYWNADKFDYITIYNNQNGDYSILEGENLIDIEKTIDVCSFKPIGGGTGREAACRIGLNK